MADRLFQRRGIQQAAQPIGAFMQPQQFNRPGATRGPLLPETSRISTIQQAGTSSVKGYNGLEELATSLGSLSKNLTQLTTRGLYQYAKGSIEQGYYDELKNATVRSQFVLQEQQEAGAEQAAGMQSQLAKTDPVAASLLRETNPWKAIGRRRALAQLASSEVSTVLQTDLALNAGELSGIQPGSPELLERKAMLTKQVLGRYGLTGEETESAVYVVPTMNKAWDTYTEKQSELYTAEVYRSSVATTGASVTAAANGLARDGLTLPSGEVIRPGDPRFGNAAGLILTQRIDRGLAVLGGEDKANALELIRKNLGLLRAQGTPGVVEAIDNIRVGSSKDPMNKRPRWIDANPFELQDFTNTALKASNENYAQSQLLIKQTLEDKWAQGPGSMVYGSPEYQDAVRQFETDARGLGYRDTEGFLKERLADDESVTEGFGGQNPLTTEERFGIEDRMSTLTPADFATPEARAALQQEARDYAMREATPEARKAAYEKYKETISKAYARFSKLPSNSDLRSRVNQEVKASLNDGEISKLKGRMRFNLVTGVLESRGQGKTTDKERRYYQFSNEVRDLLTQAAFEKFQAWQNENEGREIPVGVQSQLIAEAAKEVRASEDYKLLRKIALNQVNPDGTDKAPPRAPVNQDPSKGPVPQGASNTITPQQAREYETKPVMAPTWVHSELTRLANDQGATGVSPRLTKTAKEAGVTPYRFLLEQLKFYPALDPKGTTRGWLEFQIKNKKSGETPAATYGDQSAGPRAPGAWLNAMVLPIPTA